jgi:hypothetical protein
MRLAFVFLAFLTSCSMRPAHELAVLKRMPNPDASVRFLAVKKMPSGVVCGMVAGAVPTQRFIVGTNGDALLDDSVGAGALIFEMTHQRLCN